MNEGTSAAASKHGHTNEQDRSDSDRSPGPPFDCEILSVGLRMRRLSGVAVATHVPDHRYDLRDNAQLSLDPR